MERKQIEPKGKEGKNKGKGRHPLLPPREEKDRERTKYPDGPALPPPPRRLSQPSRPTASLLGGINTPNPCVSQGLQNCLRGLLFPQPLRMVQRCDKMRTSAGAVAEFRPLEHYCKDLDAFFHFAACHVRARTNPSCSLKHYRSSHPPANGSRLAIFMRCWRAEARSTDGVGARAREPRAWKLESTRSV